MRKGIILFLLSCILGFISFNGLRSQDLQIRNHDYFMPHKGKSMIGLYSGIPYVGISEYSYGFSNRFAAGILYGYTPFVVGYGIRLKAIIAEPSKFIRIYMRAPILYYPKTHDLGGDPWILTWPTFNIELLRKNKSRVWAGIGLVGAACVESLIGGKDKEKSMNPDNESGVEMKKMGIMQDLWNTFQIGYSKSISSKLSYMIEIAPVMKGFKLSPTQSWIGGPPIIVTFGLSCTL